MSLRLRLLGTIVGAIVLSFLISVIAARIVLQRDLFGLGKTEVTNGGGAFGGYWDARKDQIKLLVSQDSVSDALRKSLLTHNVSSVQSQLDDMARTSGLSFLTVVDANGKVVARANGTNPGSLKSDPLVQRALTGETVNTATLLDPGMLNGEGLAPQAQSTGKGIALVAAMPISDANERTIGAIYGGFLMNHDYDLVDRTTRALGSASAILLGDQIVASSILQTDGTRFVDQHVANADDVIKSGEAFTGVDQEGGTAYLVNIAPIQNDQNQTIGVRWYGVPMARIDAIVNHMTETVVLWGVLAMIVALALTLPIVERLSNTLAKRSQQVRDAAKELGVVIVGSEVSGDHVSATRASVEKSGVLIAAMAANGESSGKVAELKLLSDELQGDMLVIETLSAEMSERMRQATDRVAELNEVAGGLNQLVTGEK